MNAIYLKSYCLYYEQTNTRLKNNFCIKYGCEESRNLAIEKYKKYIKTIRIGRVTEPG